MISIESAPCPVPTNLHFMILRAIVPTFLSSGYDGIAMTKDAIYQLTIFARVAPKFAGPLHARVEPPDDSSAFEHPIAGGGTAWRKFETTFTSPVRASSSRLVIEAKSPGGVWQDYRRSRGLGFHEYLQTAENLGAAPVFCVHVGTTHIEAPLMERMGTWVQNALDALQYANAPATSEWGNSAPKTATPGPSNSPLSKMPWSCQRRA